MNRRGLLFNSFFRLMASVRLGEAIAFRAYLEVNRF